jgi:hypothetical protein
VVTALLALALAAIAVLGAWWIVQRPQRGVLVLAVAAPLHGLLLIAPVPAIAERWKEGVVALMVVGAFAARRPTRSVPTPWATALFAFLALSVGHGLVQADTAAIAALKIGFYYALALLAIWRCPLTKVDRDRFVTALVVVGVFCALVGLAQQVVGDVRLAELGYEYNSAIRTSGGFLRSFSTFNQPFPFGLYVAMVVLVCLPVAVQDPRRWRNRLFLWSLPVLLVGMATSIVRGAFLAVIVGGLYLASRWRRQLAHGAVLAVICGLALLPTGFASSAFSSSSLGDRTTGWTAGLPFIREKPFGHGIGTAGAAAEKALAIEGQLPEVETETETVSRPSELGYQPDNYYVKTLFEMGPIGLWIFAVFLAGVFLTASRTSRVAQGFDRALAVGITAHVVGLAAASLVATYFEIFPMDLFFWILLGTLLSIWRDVETDPVDERSPSTMVGSWNRRARVARAAHAAPTAPTLEMEPAPEPRPAPVPRPRPAPVSMPTGDDVVSWPLGSGWPSGS